MKREKRYLIFLSKTAQKDYKSIKDKKLLRRINSILEDLENNPILGKPLYGEYEGFRSIRTFSFRLIYEIYKNNLTITILRIQHRKESYR